MAKAAPASTRAPRGSKPVAQAFLTALDEVPAAQQVAVAKAAQAMIRTTLKDRRDKTRSAAIAAKAKSRQQPAPSRQPKAAKATGVVKAHGRGRPRKVPPIPETETEPGSETPGSTV